jgi:hypothetical protein
LAFVLLYVIDLIFSFQNSESFSFLDLENEHLIFTILNKLACISILMYFIKYEFRIARKDLTSYLKSAWNFIDYMLVLLYIIVTILFVFSANFNIVQVLNCVLAIFIFIKISFFLRLFDGFSFLVSMI